MQQRDIDELTGASGVRESRFNKPPLWIWEIMGLVIIFAVTAAFLWWLAGTYTI